MIKYEAKNAETAEMNESQNQLHENFNKKPSHLPLAKLGRLNHRKHIVDIMPFIAAVFGVQCYLMSRFSSGVESGNLALWMGFGLVGFISALFWYDRNHQVIIYSDRIESGFTGFGTPMVLNFDEIENIKTPKEEQNFAPLVVRLKSGKAIVYHFVDHPKTSGDFILEQMKKHQLQTEQKEKPDSMAA